MGKQKGGRRQANRRERRGSKGQASYERWFTPLPPLAAPLEGEKLADAILPPENVSTLGPASLSLLICLFMAGAARNAKAEPVHVGVGLRFTAPQDQLTLVPSEKRPARKGSSAGGEELATIISAISLAVTGASRMPFRKCPVASVSP